MTPKASFARQCQMSIETIRVQYNDVIARLVRELHPDFEDGRPDEAWLESIVHRRLFGDRDTVLDEHTTAALVVVVSPLAPMLELASVDLVSWAVTAATQDVIVQAKRKGYVV